MSGIFKHRLVRMNLFRVVGWRDQRFKPCEALFDSLVFDQVRDVVGWERIWTSVEQPVQMKGNRSLQPHQWMGGDCSKTVHCSANLTSPLSERHSSISNKERPPVEKERRWPCATLPFPKEWSFVVQKSSTFVTQTVACWPYSLNFSTAMGVLINCSKTFGFRAKRSATAAPHPPAWR